MCWRPKLWIVRAASRILPLDRSAALLTIPKSSRFMIWLPPMKSYHSLVNLSVYILKACLTKLIKSYSLFKSILETLALAIWSAMCIIQTTREPNNKSNRSMSSLTCIRFWSIGKSRELWIYSWHMSHTNRFLLIRNKVVAFFQLMK